MSEITLRLEADISPLVVAAGPKASTRFLEFFASYIRNANTRRAYVRAVVEFLSWSESARITSIVDVQPIHIATWIEALTQTLSVPTAWRASPGMRGSTSTTSPASSRSTRSRC